MDPMQAYPVQRQRKSKRKQRTVYMSIKLICNKALKIIYDIWILIHINYFRTSYHTQNEIMHHISVIQSSFYRHNVKIKYPVLKQLRHFLQQSFHRPVTSVDAISGI